MPTTPQKPAIRKALRRSRSWRSTVASSMWWLCSMRSMTSASSGAEPVASASAWSCSSVTRTRAAADHSAVWSRPARVCTSSSEAATVVRSVAPVRSVRRAARGSTSAWAKRSTSPSASRNSLGHVGWPRRCRPPGGGRWRAGTRPGGGRRRPPAPGGPPSGCDPSAPMSSPHRLSRSSSPTPAMTVRRGWNARENVVDPASITRRSYRTLRTRRRICGRVERPTTVCNDRHRQRSRRVADAARGSRTAGPGASIVGRSLAAPRRAQASLAQSAERFHGKEKVVGSIPTGGSPADHSDRGGVAQLVRAFDS